MENPFIVLSQIVSAFEAIGIDYVVVGSLASSIHGDYRASADIDVVAEISVEQIEPLVNALRTNFYVDDLSVRRAVTHGHSFNAIHLTAIFKVDVFLAASSLGRQQLERRQLHQLTPDMPQQIWIATPRIRYLPSFTGTASARRSPSCSGATSKGSSVLKVAGLISITYVYGQNTWTFSACSSGL